MLVLWKTREGIQLRASAFCRRKAVSTAVANLEPESWETSKYDDPEYTGAPQSVRDYFKEQTEAGLPGFTDMKELLDNMLQADPAKRWSLVQVKIQMH